MIVSSVNNFNKNNPAFQARNPEIRIAEHILRNTNKEFPRLSVSRLNDFVQTHKNRISTRQQDALNIIAGKLKAIRDFKPIPDKDPEKYLLYTLYLTKKFKLSNCADSANLAKAALAVNGIEAKRVALHGYDTPNSSTNFDRCLLIVNMAKDAILSDPRTYGKKAYVVDAWNGFVDYVPNAFKRFEADYSGDMRMSIVDHFGVKDADYDISEETKKIILKDFPTLKLDKKV